MSYKFAIARTVPADCTVYIGAATVCSWELPMDRSTTMIDMMGKISEALCTVCDPRPEPEIWESLKTKGYESQPVASEAVPGPIRRIFSEYFPPDTTLRFYELTIHTKAQAGGTKITQWMALPEDTTKHPLVCSNPRWEERRRTQWAAAQTMAPEQLEATVRSIILDTVQYYTNLTRGLLGASGRVLVLQVFNWTAIDYDEAIRLTGKVLYQMFVHDEVRPCGKDHWRLTEPKEGV